MIVPRTQLLGWAAVTLVPAALIAAIEPGWIPAALALAACASAAAAADARLAAGKLRGIEIRLPEVTRLSKDRPGAIEIMVRNRDKKQTPLRLGLPFPMEIVSPHEDMAVTLPAETEWSRVPWPCTGRRRGSYHLRSCCVETVSGLGFWSVRATLPVNGEARVYPNLLGERRHLAALFLNRGHFGVHAQRQVGKGRDFEKLREYIPGDSYEDIHWKGTAKRGRPVTKLFQVERTQEVYVIIDASRLSAREIQTASVPMRAPPVTGDAGAMASADDNVPPEERAATVLDRFITAALVVGLAAEQQGDLFGLVTFGAGVKRFVRARNGPSHYNTCRDALYTLHPQPDTPDFDEVFTFIRLRLRRRALLVFLTSLDDPVLKEGFSRHIDLISRQHLILVNMIRPAGVQPLFSGGGAADTDDLYRRLGGHVLWNDLRELEKSLKRHGVRFSLLENEMLSTQLITQYLNVKQRQLL